MNFFNDEYYDFPVLEVHAGVRYWEDADINGEKDYDGNLIPFRNGNYWEPKINVNTGQIINWPFGYTARIHYKVCDDGEYILKQNNKIYKYIDYYVPNILDCSEDQSSFGDYIIMNISAGGYIQGWNPNKIDISRWEIIE